MSELLLSAQRALLGMIYPSVRAIAIGHEDMNLLKIIYYLDREPNELDYENINEVSAEICADISFVDVEEKCIYTISHLKDLDNLSAWVYIREDQ